MAIDQQNGTMNLRAMVVDGTVKGFADRKYKFKQAVTISPTAAWKNYFFREQATPLSSATTTGMTTVLGKGIARGGAFPQAVVEWERVVAVIAKYGLEDFIYWEDVITNDVDVRDRTLRKIAEGVAKYVDDTIWDGLTENRASASFSITSYFITSGQCWDEAGANPLSDLLYAKQVIEENNYDTTNLMAFVSPKGYKDLMAWIAAKGAQFPTMGAQVLENGRAGTIAGIQLVVSNSVTTSFALVCVPKVCATWKSAAGLQTDVEEDKFKGYRIRAVELGALQLTDPKAVVMLSNTDRA